MIMSSSESNRNLLIFIEIAARLMHSNIKPERDSRVASRIINHALGIRPQRRRIETPQASTVEKEAPIPDAWDD
jgi:hypothetical protein